MVRTGIQVIAMDCGENWRKKRGFTITLINRYSKFLCAAYWSNLNYKDVSKSVKLELLWQMLSVWESYFHVSDVRTHDLKEIAKTNGLGEPLHWPDYKEAWFAEFSHHLFAVFPRNYRCCIKYWEMM